MDLADTLSQAYMYLPHNGSQRIASEVKTINMIHDASTQDAKILHSPGNQTAHNKR